MESPCAYSCGGAHLHISSPHQKASVAGFFALRWLTSGIWVGIGAIILVPRLCKANPLPTHTTHAHTHKHTCSVSLPPMGTRETTLVCVLTRPILASLGIYCTRYTVDRISGLREYDAPGDIVSDRFNNRALSLVTVLISSCSVFLYMVSRYSLASSPFVLICHCFRSSSSVKKPC